MVDIIVGGLIGAVTIGVMVAMFCAVFFWGNE